MEIEAQDAAQYNIASNTGYFGHDMESSLWFNGNNYDDSSSLNKKEHFSRSKAKNGPS